MLPFQCVTKSAKKIYHSSSKSIKLYVASLLLSADCTSMSSSCSVSYNAIYKYFDVFDAKVNAIRAHLIEAINQFATKENPGVLIVDSSQLVKLYSKKLNCLCYDFVTTQVPHDYVKRKGFPSKAQEIASIILRVCFWAVAV